MSRTPAKFNPEPFDYHQELEIDIESLTNLGQGLGRIDGWVVFVPFSLPGERVLARIFRNHKAHSEADLIEVLQPSPHRVEARCELFGLCGGCQYQNYAYEQQLLWKQTQVQELLSHMANIEAEVLPVIPSPQQWGYRSKITPHFQKPKDGKISAIGFLKAGVRSQLIDVKECPIASDAINQALPKVRARAHAEALSYRKGATLLLRDSADEADLVITENNEVCEEHVGDLRFQFAAGEFFQNNPSILPAFTEHARTEALNAGENRSANRYLVDTYCGSGLFAISCAAHFEQVSGIEISEAAIEWATRNTKLNDIDNCKFQQGDALDIFAEIEYPAEQTAVIIDPPRKGSNPGFIEQLLAFAPATIVYISCNPATQIRDLELLLANDQYQLSKIQPFDLFPHTRHLECVITLHKI
ncbi:MAG: class I SAM-dependent RNA methyltransferase [Verrucomicrobiales bacterium]|nr:class I SAM-dependent RNA methyltransferase [Verrucomicrobiales bacterium]